VQSILEKIVTITNRMTLGGEIETTMLRKGPLGARSIIRSTMNTVKGMKITNEMTLGGEKEPTMLKKRT
jgi:hypothetical protein